MKNKLFYLIFIFLITGSFGYARENGVMKLNVAKDTLEINAAAHVIDEQTTRNLEKQLKPIQLNFKRINSIKTWSLVKKKNIEGESAEGGEATFYYKNKLLEKIIARHYGEMGQTLIEYYLLNGKLSFVFEKEYTYNRPLFYDAKAMKENNDTETFDFKKSKITETRNYFEKGKLIHIICNRDSVASFSEVSVKQEEKNSIEDFKRLLKLLQEK